VAEAASGTVTEQGVRDALAGIPLEKLRAAGLLDGLLELAGVRLPEAEEAEAVEEATIDDLDTDALISMAIGGGDDD
jgi:hypothetical protein